jgi:hypothetical protein
MIIGHIIIFKYFHGKMKIFFLLWGYILLILALIVSREAWMEIISALG